MARLLELSDKNKKEVEGLVAFASRPENLYKLGVSKWVPGDRAEFRREVNTFRLVFTLTESMFGETFRHMSLSVPAKGKLPDPLIAYTLATWCGFTGGEVKDEVTIQPGADWMMGQHETDACVVLAQKLASAPDA